MVFNTIKVESKQRPPIIQQRGHTCARAHRRRLLIGWLGVLASVWMLGAYKQHLASLFGWERRRALLGVCYWSLLLLYVSLLTNALGPASKVFVTSAACTKRREFISGRILSIRSRDFFEDLLFNQRYDYNRIGISKLPSYFLPLVSRRNKMAYKIDVNGKPCNPTLRPAVNFNPAQDVELLKKAMDGLGKFNSFEIQVGLVGERGGAWKPSHVIFSMKQQKMKNFYIDDRWCYLFYFDE